MASKHPITHLMIVCYKESDASLIEAFFEEYHYDYEYAELGINVNTSSYLGGETKYPKNIVKAVLKNNNIKDSNKKIVFLVSRSDIDKSLFDNEVELYQKEISEVIAHTQHNVSIGYSVGKSHNRGHMNLTTKKSVSGQCLNSR
tara:strand:+ start:11590 stop:12021 length:432 start_codon:yes stop_codon:yes gene_type:complete